MPGVWHTILPEGQKLDGGAGFEPGILDWDQFAPVEPILYSLWNLAGPTQSARYTPCCPTLFGRLSRMAFAEVAWSLQ